MTLNRLVPLLAVLLAGCATTDLNPDAGPVQVVFDQRGQPLNCEPLDTWVGTEGHWYSYWFITNFDLTTGALNQLRNRAAALGGNRVEISSKMDFQTSVTLIGHIYRCPTP
ncbi:DUF4156 domain-containing protein [Ferrimonas marina]|uniref:Outer membrane lipoprotein n=1 Tax=Ferrimonas marina TaxID=299255 RepID=A0A1M5YHW8_9GAMM|nr:DUF4156 domain-containing protein [Ferrimonas marina]SHI11488.1 protein of unknown function [Ferrimonas marina]